MTTCNHPQTEIRYKPFKTGDGRHFAEQCTVCGKKVTQDWLPKPANHATCQKWDYELEETFLSGYRQDQSQQRLTTKREQHHDYELYINTSVEWQKRRALVLQRACNLCEACLISTASQVHHTDYDFLKDEVLFDLRAVCKSCHSKIHNIKFKNKDV